MSPGPFLEPVFVCKKAEVLLPPEAPLSSFISLSLYPLVDVPVPKGFCDLSIVEVSAPLAVSSCPVGDLVPFESAVVGQVRQEWWSFLPACQATPQLPTPHSSPQAEGF